MSASEESFVSFPLEVTGPIRVPSPLDEGAVGGVVRDTLARERAHVATLEKLAQAEGADPALGKLRERVGPETGVLFPEDQAVTR